MTCLMIDLETMSTHPDAAIAAIGACTFELREAKIHDTFHTSVSLESNEQYHRHFSGGTITFWLQQPHQAQRALLKHQTNLPNALRQLRDWIARQPQAINTVWANDPDFDCTILLSALAAVKQSWPFSFWHHRSVRTIGELAFEDPNERKQALKELRAAGTHHNARDDAVAQAGFVQLCYQMLQTGYAFQDPA